MASKHQFTWKNTLFKWPTVYVKYKGLFAFHCPSVVVQGNPMLLLETLPDKRPIYVQAATTLIYLLPISCFAQVSVQTLQQNAQIATMHQMKESVYSIKVESPCYYLSWMRNSCLGILESPPASTPHGTERESLLFPGIIFLTSEMPCL